MQADILRGGYRVPSLGRQNPYSLGVVCIRVVAFDQLQKIGDLATAEIKYRSKG